MQILVPVAREFLSIFVPILFFLGAIIEALLKVKPGDLIALLGKKRKVKETVNYQEKGESWWNVVLKEKKKSWQSS